MANICVICDKRPQVANNVSNANNRTKRWVYPNVHTIRFTLKGQKNVKRGAVCTKCLKSGKIEKVV
ncbi:MAG: 50S ribosomal protein L28 [candidate division TM6 bacterium GW2011_GWF2_28_16]|jgi:large subunit ribosomal protein L28|nr:MAG: 50S ribosomal protein L28 [candidate division TM6 bacterium GW2011_GWF2_28_16]